MESVDRSLDAIIINKYTAEELVGAIKMNGEFDKIRKELLTNFQESENGKELSNYISNLTNSYQLTEKANEHITKNEQYKLQTAITTAVEQSLDFRKNFAKILSPAFLHSPDFTRKLKESFDATIDLIKKEKMTEEEKKQHMESKKKAQKIEEKVTKEGKDLTMAEANVLVTGNSKQNVNNISKTCDNQADSDMEIDNESDMDVDEPTFTSIISNSIILVEKNDANPIIENSSEVLDTLKPLLTESIVKEEDIKQLSEHKEKTQLQSPKSSSENYLISKNFKKNNSLSSNDSSAVNSANASRNSTPSLSVSDSIRGNFKSSKPEEEFYIEQKIAAFIPNKEGGENCIIVVVEAFDKERDIYTVRDVDPDPDEEDDECVWKLKKDKLINYLQTSLTYKIRDPVYSLFREKGKKRMSTEFYLSKVVKVAKSGVTVEYEDGDSAIVKYTDLFKAARYKHFNYQTKSNIQGSKDKKKYTKKKMNEYSSSSEEEADVDGNKDLKNYSSSDDNLSKLSDLSEGPDSDF